MANPLMEQQAQPGQTTPVPTPNFEPQMPTMEQGGAPGGALVNNNQPQIQQPPEEEERSPEEEAERAEGMESASLEDKLNAFLEMTNMAEKMDEDELTKIGVRVVEEYDIDQQSRQDWMEANSEFVELARMVSGKSRMYADGVVANVKYPILAVASLQFASRAYPNIVAGEAVVKGKKIGRDKTGQKQKRADRMAEFMSYQFLEQMDCWDEDTDRMLVVLPIVGSVFRKTYRDFVNNRNVSVMVPAEDLVINYWAQDFEPRVTQHVPLYPNEILERVRGGLFLDKEFGKPVDGGQWKAIKQHQDSRDEERPHLFLEQHRWEDLDDDGYKEPYVVTVHYDTRQVVRIVARYDMSGVDFNDKKKKEIVRIRPTQYFTHYFFFPSFDGSFYGMGFGTLLGSMNRTVNTNLNQLLDAGTMSNRQCGFLGKGVRLPEGSKAIKFKHGEWKYLDVTGDDLRKSIYPLPANPPSDVLFKLLQFMVEAAEKLASNADVLSGNQPQANVPATTTLALIEQGLKVYSSIYLRVHKALNREFKKMVRLNRLYIEDDEYQRVLDDSEATVQDFFDSDLDVTPVSDVADLNDMQKIMKAQALRELVGQGLNDQEIYRRYLTALNIPDVESIITGGTPPKDPRITIEEMRQQTAQAELQLKAKEMELDQLTQQHNAAKAQSEAQKTQIEAEIARAQQEVEVLKAEIEREKQQMELMKSQAEMQLAQGEQQAQQQDMQLKYEDQQHQHAMDKAELGLKAQDQQHQHAVDREDRQQSAEDMQYRHQHEEKQSDREHERGKQELEIKKKIASKPIPKPAPRGK